MSPPVHQNSHSWTLASSFRDTARQRDGLSRNPGILYFTSRPGRCARLGRAWAHPFFKQRGPEGPQQRTRVPRERAGRLLSSFPTPHGALLASSEKEVIQPQVPLRLPCYDFAPVTKLAFGRSLPRVGSRTSGTPSFHGVTGGVYKARERIHRGVADPRLLAIPPSCSRVADYNPNLDRLFGIRSISRYRCPLYRPL